jgi:ketosteroid isomerase-like protein
MTPEENRQIVFKFIKSQQDHKGKVDESLVADGLQWWISGFGFFDRKSYAEMIETIRPHLAKWYQFTPTNSVAEGDQVAVEMSGNATMVNGRFYENEYCMVFKLQSGRIYSIKEYYDTNTARVFYADILK